MADECVNTAIRVSGNIGPSIVRALPVAACTNEGGPYFRVSPRRACVLQFWNIAWAPKSQKYEDSNRKIFGDPP